MDFVTHLPQTQQRHGAVWVIVDRLKKSAHEEFPKGNGHTADYEYSVPPSDRW